LKQAKANQAYTRAIIDRSPAIGSTGEVAWLRATAFGSSRLAATRKAKGQGQLTARA